MFDAMLVMASWGLVKALINDLLLYHCFPVLYLILSFHSILGSGLGFGPEKVAQILDSLAQNWKVWTTSASRQAYESDFRSLVAPLPIA